MKAHIITLERVDSTNKQMFQQPKSLMHHGLCIATEYQTCGRGQSTNVWESNAGENLLFSLLLEPKKINPADQFLISQFVSLAIIDVIESYIDSEVTIKWPNDIYVGDKKLAGILIEQSICGAEISKSVIGIGLNVNQVLFSHALPNPISLKQITGNTANRELLLQELCEKILERYQVLSKNNIEELRQRYLQKLYRAKGFHPFLLPNGKEIKAKIVDIHPLGPILLEDEHGEQTFYAFKEIQFKP